MGWGVISCFVVPHNCHDYVFVYLKFFVHDLREVKVLFSKGKHSSAPIFYHRNTCDISIIISIFFYKRKICLLINPHSNVCIVCVIPQSTSYPRKKCMGDMWHPRPQSHPCFMTLYLISPWTKWPPFCRRYFQMHFCEWKFLYFD